MVDLRVRERLLALGTSCLLFVALACDAGGSSELANRTQAQVFSAVYQAETMAHSTGGPVTGGWNIWSNGFIETNHTFQCSDAQIKVVARGQSAAGVAPHMVVRVRGQQVLSTFVSSASWTDFVVPVSVEPGGALIRVEFDNDYLSGNQDRNLYVDRVEVTSDCEPASEGADLDVTLQVTSQWSTGYCATLNVKNPGVAAVPFWAVELDLHGGTLGNGWNATFTADGTRLLVTPLAWNSSILAGQTNSSVGLCVNRNGSTEIASVVEEDEEASCSIDPRVVLLPTSKAPALLPQRTKITCNQGPDTLEDGPCPVLEYAGIRYWALSDSSNANVMTIAAYDDEGELLAAWTRAGARYVWDIQLDEAEGTVTFHGQSNDAIEMSLDELKIDGDAPPAVVRIARESAPLPIGGTKLTCLLDRNELEPAVACPVIKWQGLTYWVYSDDENAFAMTVAAYDRKGSVVAAWEHVGSRYIWDIQVTETNETVALLGQDSSSILLDYRDLLVAEGGVPFISWEDEDDAPALLPQDTKVTCIAGPDTLDEGRCPVLQYRGVRYWALSDVSNATVMTIAAYDQAGQLLAAWTRPGARYVWDVQIGNDGLVTFFGQGSGEIEISLDELVIDDDAPPAVARIDRDDAPTAPSGTKLSCLVERDELEPAEECPVLAWQGLTYWIFSDDSNATVMTVAAYEPGGDLVAAWEHAGSRYIWDIEVAEAARTVALLGQGSSEIELDFADLVVPEGGVPVVLERAEADLPGLLPQGTKVTCMAGPDTLDEGPCPVLVYRGVQYWALSDASNASVLTIAAYDSDGVLLAAWERPGARYVWDVDVSPDGTVTFFGQGSGTVELDLDDLAVDDDAPPAIVRIDRDLAPTPLGGTKLSCLVERDQLDPAEECPVIKWQGLTYWVLSDVANASIMTVAAYDRAGTLVAAWAHAGSRYIWDVEVAEAAHTLTLLGQGSSEIQLDFAELLVPEGGVPFVSDEDTSSAPAARPQRTKVTCMQSSSALTSGPCPVLHYRGVDYWALSDSSNATVMTIAAYDQSGELLAAWIRPGARYVWDIQLGTDGIVTFFGQGTGKVELSLEELVIDDDAPPAIARIDRESAPTPPGGTKVSCLASRTALTSAEECPVIKWQGLTYWVLSDTDNSYTMSVAAYDGAGSLQSIWRKDGSRYIWDITVDEPANRLTLLGQGTSRIDLSYCELPR